MNSEVTVFLVDDDLGALRSLAYLLKSEGYWTETYASAVAFLDAYDPARPGCLVLDVRMAEMNGLQLQDELASRGHPIPIVFITGHGNVPVSVRAMKQGAVDFLEKPVDDETLLARVREALEKDAAQRRAAAVGTDIADRIDRLTPRERQVMGLLFEGKSTKQIAAKFGIGNQTVAKHRERVLKKMEVGNDVELTRLLALRLPKRP